MCLYIFKTLTIYKYINTRNDFIVDLMQKTNNGSHIR